MRQAVSVTTLVELIGAHVLDSAGLGQSAYILGQLLEPGDDELNLMVTSLLRHIANQLVLIEHADVPLTCPSCGKEA